MRLQRIQLGTLTIAVQHLHDFVAAPLNVDALLCEPELSVVVFRRRGWSASDCRVWSARLLARGLAFVVPTTVDDLPALRFCFVNPRTTMQDVELILGTLGSPAG